MSVLVLRFSWKFQISLMEVKSDFDVASPIVSHGSAQLVGVSAGLSSFALDRAFNVSPVDGGGDVMAGLLEASSACSMGVGTHFSVAGNAKNSEADCIGLPMPVSVGSLGVCGRVSGKSSYVGIGLVGFRPVGGEHCGMPSDPIEGAP